ncbi:MAG: hypothetical protein ACFFCP_10865 [Promethearchaeota archaeon]
MRRKLTLLVIVTLLSSLLGSIVGATGYSSQVLPGSIITWQIESTPNATFNMYYTGGGNWLAQNDSLISFNVESHNNDVEGVFTIGNVTVPTNDTDIARDLILGVWGTPTEWWPGLFIGVNQSEIDYLNNTAYASAERVAGNYLNGTMESSFDLISDANEIQHQCIVFDYVQDPTGFGEPQRTYLAYALDTGILIEANTSYSASESYELAFRFAGVATVTIVDFTVDFRTALTLLGVGGGLLLALAVVLFWKRVGNK